MVWHVGAIVGQAIAHAGLRWRAESAEYFLERDTCGERKEESAAPSKADEFTTPSRKSFLSHHAKRLGWNAGTYAYAKLLDLDYKVFAAYRDGVTKRPGHDTRAKIAKALGVPLSEVPH